MVSTRNDDSKRLKNKDIACMIDDVSGVLCIDPSLPIFNLLGKKYTIMVVGVIGNRGSRGSFNEIINAIPFSSSTIISRRLKELEKFGLILKDSGSGSVTYSLTDFGMKIREAMMPLFRITNKEDNAVKP